MAIRFSIFPADDPSRPSEIAFDLEKILVGRGTICDLRLPHPLVSYHHATVEVDGSRYTIRDEASTNGTKVNGSRIPASFRHRLHGDDVIEIGGFRLIPTLSVPMSGTHSEERTESVARSLMEGISSSVEDARIRIVSGPAQGETLVLPRHGKESYSVGSGEDDDLRLPADALQGHRLAFEKSIKGWVLSVRKGDPEGPELQRTLLSDGQTLDIGPTEIEITDPLDSFYRRLLRDRQEIEWAPPPDLPSPAEPGSASLPDGGDDPEPFPPEPDTEPDEPPGPEPALGDQIESRTETMRSRRDAGRMPEYSWMVVTIGIIAFLGSIALLLMLMF